jgi:hypothetical protein
MLPIVPVIYLLTLNSPCFQSQASVRTKSIPAQRWMYEVRRDLWESHLFNTAFPQNWWAPEMGSLPADMAEDGYPRWTRWTFAVVTQSVTLQSQHSKKPVPDRLKRGIQRLRSEYRKELKILDALAK